VTLTMGSDAPVARLDPWLAMAAAVHRSADERAAWNLAQSLTVAQSLAASTDGQCRNSADLSEDCRDELHLRVLQHDVVVSGSCRLLQCGSQGCGGAGHSGRRARRSAGTSPCASSRAKVTLWSPAEVDLIAGGTIALGLSERSDGGSAGLDLCRMTCAELAACPPRALQGARGRLVCRPRRGPSAASPLRCHATGWPARPQPERPTGLPSAAAAPGRTVVRGVPAVVADPLPARRDLNSECSTVPTDTT